MNRLILIPFLCSCVIAHAEPVALPDEIAMALVFPCAQITDARQNDDTYFVQCLTHTHIQKNYVFRLDSNRYLYIIPSTEFLK